MPVAHSASTAEPESAGSQPDPSAAGTDSSAATAPSAEGMPAAAGQEGTDSQQQGEAETADTGRQLSCQLVNSSWCGLLAALSVLLEAR